MLHIFMVLFFALSFGAPILGDCCCIPATTTSTTCCDSGCACPCSGKTFFSVPPLYQPVRPEWTSGFWNDRILAAQDGLGGAIDIVAFGSRATNNKNLANYFLPYCKNCLTVSEALNDPTASAANPPADLMAQHFNIVTVNGIDPTLGTPFRSRASFCASHSQVGVGLHWKQGFCFDADRTKWWYVDLSLPITHVKNKMRLFEAVISNGGGAATNVPNTVANLTQAFRQSTWNYGRIDNCYHSKTGVADITLLFGRQFLWTECCNAASYLGVLIPTGNRPCAVNVFEPIVGHNGNPGIIWGGLGGFQVWASECHSHKVNFLTASNFMYLFTNTQRRSFDLKGKPWSRYQEVYLNQAQAQAAANLDSSNPIQAQYLSTPGINVFTQCVRVSPGLQVDLQGTLMYQRGCGLQVEAGYTFFARHQECITLSCPWQVGPALKSELGAGTTNQVRNITPNPYLNLDNQAIDVADYNQNLIRECDLDLQSAAHPYIFSHTVHGAIGKRWDELCVPLDVNIGASYEFSGKEYAVMQRWIIWGKLGLTF